ncbi:hypothetical protein [Longirhabdus pacifica]|uniref:hypothetical protein n=1 Tax=Longirhabdus pacifica TaxID=2305227 RepID=UPI001009309C|nr:hypothetical protein [Longirhabdus pacifica]
MKQKYIIVPKMFVCLECDMDNEANEFVGMIEATDEKEALGIFVKAHAQHHDFFEVHAYRHPHNEEHIIKFFGDHTKFAEQYLNCQNFREVIEYSDELFDYIYEKDKDNLPYSVINAKKINLL